jgi:hypothetical protein
MGEAPHTSRPIRLREPALMERTATSLTHEHYPHGECAALGTHANNLEQTIGDYVGKSKARQFEKQLMSVHSVEMMIS